MVGEGVEDGAGSGEEGDEELVGSGVGDGSGADDGVLPLSAPPSSPPEGLAPFGAVSESDSAHGQTAM